MSPAASRPLLKAVDLRTGGGTWLFVLPWDLRHPGGVNQVVENLYEANRRVAGSESLLFIASWEARRQRIDLVDGRRTIHSRLRVPWDAINGARSMVRYALWLPGAIRSLSRLLTQESVEIVNVHYPSLTALTWALLPAVIRGQVCLALSFHGSDVVDAVRSRGVERWLWRRLLAAASSITVCNRNLKVALASLQARALDKITVLDNGIDPSNLSKASTAAQPAVPQHFLLSLGTFEHKKGHDVTVDAFARLAACHPALHLVIAGRTDSGSTLDAVRAQTLRLGCADRVHLLPNLDHASAMALLRQSRALVLASRDEPFGIVLLEAGVFRRPAIATAVCGAARRLPEGALLRVPVEDAAALAAAIDRVVSDAALAQRLGATLFSAVVEHFTWDKVAKSYRNAIKPLANAAG